MLSIKEARKILGKDGENLSDEQVQELLDLMFSLCNFVYNKQKKEAENKQ